MLLYDRLDAMTKRNPLCMLGEYWWAYKTGACWVVSIKDLASWLKGSVILVWSSRREELLPWHTIDSHIITKSNSTSKFKWSLWGFFAKAKSNLRIKCPFLYACWYSYKYSLRHVLSALDQAHLSVYGES